MNLITILLHIVLLVLFCATFRKYNTKTIYLIPKTTNNKSQLDLSPEQNKAIIEIIKERLSITFKILAFAASVLVFGLYLFSTDIDNKTTLFYVGCVIISVTIVFMISLLQSILSDMSLFKTTKLEECKVRNAEFHYLRLPLNIVLAICACIFFSAISMILNIPKEVTDEIVEIITYIAAFAGMLLAVFMGISTNIEKIKNNIITYYILNFVFLILQLSFWLLCGFFKK